MKARLEKQPAGGGPVIDRAVRGRAYAFPGLKANSDGTFSGYPAAARK